MKRIFLIGFMGSGKTTLGKALSRQLGIDFIDLDLYIEARYHKTIREIFAESGEERFRQIEKSLLHEVADFENVIIAAGGGTPCFFDNIDYMNAHGTCIYLRPRPTSYATGWPTAATPAPSCREKTMRSCGNTSNTPCRNATPSTPAPPSISTPGHSIPGAKSTTR